MQKQRLSLFLAALALASVAWPSGQPGLVVEVAPAVAPIQPQADGRRLLRLPTLEFEFDIGASCGPDQAVASVSISVADTRKTLTREAFDDDALARTTFRLPARQIAPIVVDEFCSEAQSESSSLLLRDAVTAQVSLRCASAEEESITYVSQTLDVSVVCEVGSEAQGSEAESTDR